MGNKVHEIAVRVVKPGKEEPFVRRRSAFIQKLKAQKGVLVDREFESLVAVPTPDDRQVFIGMTTYENLATVNRVQMTPGVMFKFIPFFMQMSLKAYVFCEQTGGPELELDRLGADGKLVQIWVRRTAPGGFAKFQAAHEAFFTEFTTQEGIGPHYELKVVKGNHIDGLTVGITEYASEDAMAGAFDAFENHDATIAYFDTFEPVAVQFAKLASND